QALGPARVGWASHLERFVALHVAAAVEDRAALRHRDRLVEAAGGHDRVARRLQRTVPLHALRGAERRTLVDELVADAAEEVLPGLHHSGALLLGLGHAAAGVDVDELRHHVPLSVIHGSTPGSPPDAAVESRGR